MAKSLAPQSLALAVTAMVAVAGAAQAEIDTSNLDDAIEGEAKSRVESVYVVDGNVQKRVETSIEKGEARQTEGYNPSEEPRMRIFDISQTEGYRPPEGPRTYPPAPGSFDISQTGNDFPSEEPRMRIFDISQTEGYRPPEGPRTYPPAPGSFDISQTGNDFPPEAPRMRIFDISQTEGYRPPEGPRTYPPAPGSFDISQTGNDFPSEEPRMRIFDISQTEGYRPPEGPRTYPPATGSFDISQTIGKPSLVVKKPQPVPGAQERGMRQKLERRQPPAPVREKPGAVGEAGRSSGNGAIAPVPARANHGGFSR